MRPVSLTARCASASSSNHTAIAHKAALFHVCRLRILVEITDQVGGFLSLIADRSVASSS
jgi:hypothetical protein